PLPMKSASLSDEIDSMEDSLVRSRFSDKLTSRRGAWVSLGIVLISLVVLFGLFSGFQSPSQNAQAPVDSESTQVSELMKEFPDAERQYVLFDASRVARSAVS